MINIIAAISLDRAIGINKKGKVFFPWNKTISGDHISSIYNIIKGNRIIIGNNTYKLYNNLFCYDTDKNIVLSNINSGNKDECVYINNMKDAISCAIHDNDNNDIFIVGGRQVFLEGMKFADNIYLNILPYMVHKKSETKNIIYFPSIDSKNFVRYNSTVYDCKCNFRTIIYRRLGGV